jgi:serine/threonine protein kinase
MGELYLAMSGTRGIEKLCVIKKVLPHLIAPENAQRFRDEAMVVVKLSHGNLVTVFDAGRNQHQVYLAMEYVDGKDLLATWNRCAERRVPFPVDVAAYIVKELARGLGYAHAFGGLRLVHRDVSPANVLLSYTGEVKLTDFGLATSTLKLQRTAPGIIFGKLSYLAPEQARCEPLDGRADIYAAGILLWELLTGQQLFPVRTAAPEDPGARRDSTAEALERLRAPRISPPSSVTARVPPELDRIVMRALAPEREKRYQHGEELRADLGAFLARTAPQTDAARLAAFMRPLFADDMEAERREREALLASAASLLSGAIESPAAARSLGTGATPAQGNGDRPARRKTDENVKAPAAIAAAGAAGAGGDPRIGTTLGGRYLLRRLCGEGAMGRVYEGQHIDIGRRVAVKILSSSYHHSQEVVERFRREARAASKIGHPNIVDVTDSGTTPDGAFYFVMEYLDGVNLEELIAREGKLPAERALLIAAQIGRALQAAHAADIIHRDLKPANVMLINRKDEDDFVKVLDFGISKELETGGNGGNGGGRRGGGGLTRPDVAVGTPVYMAPEQAAGMPADALTDVYAVGGLLYEMLSGRAPCEGDDILAVLNKKAIQDPQPIGVLCADLPGEVQRLVMRALARLPKDRFPSMAAFKDEVLKCLATVQGAPSGARPPAAEPSTMKMVTLRPRAWMLATGVAALAVVAALISFTQRDADTRAAASAAALPAVAPVPGPVVVAIGPPSSASAAQPTAGRLHAPATPAHGSAPQLAARRPSSSGAAPGAAAGPAWPEPSTPVLADGASGSGAPTPAVLRRPNEAARGSGRRASTTDRGMLAAAKVADETPDEILARGQSAFDGGNYPEAIRRGKEAVGAGAALGGHLLIGDAYYHLERFSDALREYEAALAVDPANTLARRGRELAARAASTP